MESPFLPYSDCILSGPVRSTPPSSDNQVVKPSGFTSYRTRVRKLWLDPLYLSGVQILFDFLIDPHHRTLTVESMDPPTVSP